MTINTREYQKAWRDKHPEYVGRNGDLKKLRRRAMQSVANNHPAEWRAILNDSPRSWSLDRKYGRLIAAFRTEYEIAYAALRFKEGLD